MVIPVLTKSQEIKQDIDNITHYILLRPTVYSTIPTIIFQNKENVTRHLIIVHVYNEADIHKVVLVY